MRRSSRWYLYPIFFAIIGFGIFVAVHDFEIPKTPVRKEIRYDKLQK